MLKFIGPSTLALWLLAGCANQPSSPAAAPTPPPTAQAASPTAQAYLEITMKVEPANRRAAADVYAKYKQPFLDDVPGAISKQLLVRDEDVVVLHGFDSTQHAADYLKSPLFNDDVVVELKPLMAAAPDVRIYAAP